MYKVYYYMTGSTKVSTRTCASLKEAVAFSLTLPSEAVLEIKRYDNETNNTKN